MSNPPNLDLNVNNYTIADLLIILDLTAENLSEDTVTEKTNEYMLQYSNDDNKDMVFFF